ncbi:HAD-IIB family hydrolase [Musicola paradisiaca]|uniref:HAD-superfamily hydrolase, subfamily IIB n=1 Tax=Musicola paradisiaca (strain Ech703) TaxID=579405 RepID=C6C4X9_MUSP7|nr:HAD-IIB family hydrolase [Musicola paradisiaca]ACS85589.1 HAD-superfamily hydrolase, subfamily IIB [Musicola paradisiaca Ech703]
MIKLIITDLDGTFLNSAGDFNRMLFPDVNALMQRKGVHFAPCTGKQCDRVEELFGASAADFWILGDSATRIKHRGRYAYQSLIDNALGREMIATLEAVNQEPVIIACTPNGAVLKDSLAPAMIEKVKKSYATVRLVPDFNAVTDDFVKISLFDENGRCHQTRTHLAPYDDRAYIVVSEAAWIDIADAGVHKGSTVARLQDMLQVTPQETAVFGDGLNDIELMRCGDYSFAMRNAFEETKAAARFITRSNDDDAVMHTIIQLLNLQPDAA